MTKIFPSNGQDLILQVTVDDNVDNFELTFYTSNIESGFTKDETDLKEGNLIKIDASEMAALDNGMLKVMAHTYTADSDFNDNEYDEIQIINTDFYIKNE